MFLFLYADDTAILSESPACLQAALDAMSDYCSQYKLRVNVNKTKIMVFSRGKIRKLPKFTYNGEDVEIVHEFQYLGIKLNYNNKFTVAQKNFYDRASKVMFSLLRKSRKLLLPIDLQLDLFDKMITPILLYGSEVWCYQMCDFANKLQLRFCKLLLGAGKSTPTSMVLGELGQYPLDVYAKSRMLAFWYKLVDSENEHKWSSIMYRFILQLHVNDVQKSHYIEYIENILNSLGFGDIWLCQNSINLSYSSFKTKIKRRLQDQFIQKWQGEINDNELYYNYRIFKDTFALENYLVVLPFNLAKYMFKFRTLNHKLPIQRGRLYGIPRNERVCTKCQSADLGDEFHYVLCCNYFNHSRKYYLKPYYYRHCNTITFKQLFSCSKKKTLLKLCRFLIEIMRSM